MYYILNETNQIIAADDNLLALCGLSHIDELSLKIALGDTKFDLSEDNLIINTNNIDETFSISKTSLSSMLGHLTLVTLQVEKEKTEEDDLSVFTLDDTIEDISEETEIAIDDNELFDLAVKDETESSLDTVEDSFNVMTEDTET